MTQDIKFEKALEKLEQIVEDLEMGNLSLDDSLKKYEEGVKLSRTCQKKLTEAEGKIEILTKALDGELEKSDFDADSVAAAPKPAKRSKRKAKADEDLENEDLLI